MFSCSYSTFSFCTYSSRVIGRVAYASFSVWALAAC